MTEFQRNIYEIAIQSEWMSENAFIMAWDDFLITVKDMHLLNRMIPEIDFMKWLLN